MTRLSTLSSHGTAKGLIARLKEMYTLIAAIIIYGTTNEIEVTDNGDGSWTVGLPNNVTITNNLTVGDDVNVGGDVYVKKDKKIYLDGT